MEKRSLVIDLSVFQSLTELSSQEQACYALAESALHNAYAPYSGFKVSAVIRFTDGTTFSGTNQENAAYPSGLCAERVAIFGAKSNFPGKTIDSIYLLTEKGNNEPYSPCGACRQALIEYEQMQEQNIQLFMKSGDSSIFKFDSIAGLLPLAFDGKSALKKQ